MKIHEYQAKAILARHGVPVPRGEVAFSAEEAGAIARRLGGGVTVVKAQIHAGGRGKGGGVKVVKDAATAEETAKQMLGMTLVTHQTGPEGRKVERLLVEEGVKIAKELYLGLLVDRAAGCPVLMASSEGGMDIEEVAEHNPDAIKKVAISPITGLTGFQARQLAFGIGLAPEHVNKAVKVMQQIYETFVATDASLIEVNPLIVTESGDVMALDAKVTFDDNALYRHQDFRDLRDLARGGSARDRGAASSRSTTSGSTAPSAAWSTAPAWPWRRWTSSSWRAGSRPTSSTSAAAPTPSRSRTPSAS